jgi:type IV secretory pathway component VirB8
LTFAKGNEHIQHTQVEASIQLDSGHLSPVRSTPIKKSMDTGNIIALIALILGVLGSAFVLIFKAGGLNTKVGQIEKDVVEIKTDVKALDVKTAVLPSLVTTVNAIFNRVIGKGVIESASPRTLTDHGRFLLEQSGTKEIVNERFDEVLNGVKTRSPKNAYQAEAAVIEVVKSLVADPQSLSRLQDGAFKLGTDTETLLLVGAIYVRDRIIEELGFRVEDIDKEPSAPSSS